MLRAGIGLLAGTALAGCSGGDSSDNSSNNSTESGGSAPQSSGSSTTPGTVGTVGTTAVDSQILGSEAEFSSDGELTIDLEGERTPDQIRLVSPKGQFGSYQPSNYESTATFTLIRESSKQFGYEKYPYGTYHAVALKGNQPIDRQTYRLEPRFTVSEIESSSSRVSITLQNSGTGPAAITAARIYNSNITPGPNQWGGGYVDQDSIVTPGDSIRVETRLMGFANQFPIKGNKSASDYDKKYCTGRVYPVTVSYREFGQIRSSTGSLSFGGNPQDAPNGSSAVCSDYTLNLNAGSSQSTTSATSSTSSSGLRTLTSTASSTSESGPTTAANSTSN
ncbi:hypothetical protein [Halococcus sp. IIIV-5B]|uniref:hypothetical protein n=1 Tax=Halococcus sp. IIIV-5B TaxID=2321230 RepID=UPI000E765EA8|nr:hypothetical protein [Halococcus sp. IIIV-5B]RJT04731.1 hypothetical protein D3261_08970 [Halococcus sp. IIIV-5B]